MRQRPWEEVVAALRLLGSTVVFDGTYQVTVWRGASKLQRVRKLSPVPRAAQANIIAALDYSEEEYLNALGALADEG